MSDDIKKQNENAHSVYWPWQSHECNYITIPSPKPRFKKESRLKNLNPWHAYSGCLCSLAFQMGTPRICFCQTLSNYSWISMDFPGMNFFQVSILTATVHPILLTYTKKKNLITSTPFTEIISGDSITGHGVY